MPASCCTAAPLFRRGCPGTCPRTTGTSVSQTRRPRQTSSSSLRGADRRVAAGAGVREMRVRRGIMVRRPDGQVFQASKARGKVGAHEVSAQALRSRRGYGPRHASRVLPGRRSRDPALGGQSTPRLGRTWTMDKSSTLRASAPRSRCKKIPFGSTQVGDICDYLVVYAY